MYFSSYMKTRKDEGVVMILSNARAVKVTFDKFIEIQIELNNKRIGYGHGSPYP